MSSAVLSSNVTIDDDADTITIYGIRYHAELFRGLGLDRSGQLFRIIDRKDGVVTIERVMGRVI